MRRISLLSILLLFELTVSYGQKNILVTIGDKKFTVEEFERIYKKNNTQLNDENDVKTPQAYIDMFIDYKLKVIEAEKRGLDTLKTFIEELAGYRGELAKPYLTDVTANDSLVKVAYFRTVNEINASHILITCNKEDTLTSYNKAIEIRNKFINKEKTFEELALEYSIDQSVQANKGNLGYFSAFQMVTPFEDAAYNTPVGSISMPVRSAFGYHLIYVHDLKPSEGEVKVAHIMKMFKNPNHITQEEEAGLKQKIDSIYALLKNGADFSALAMEQSDDKSTGRKGGEMRYIRSTFDVKEFTKAAFALEKDGDLSEPVRSPFGYHILKRLDRRAPQSFDKVKEDLAQRVRKDEDRSKYSKAMYIEKMKKENGYKAFVENIATFKNYLGTIEGDTIKNGLPKEILDLNMYQVGNRFYTISDFWNVQELKKKNDSKFLGSVMLKHVDVYAEEVIYDYENTLLEKKYPELVETLQEYRDGMLLFAIMEDEVWNKASLDTIGFTKYYESNKGKYSWDKHYDGLLIKCVSAEVKDSVKALIASGVSDPEEIKAKINSEDDINVKITKGKWEKGQNERIDYFVFGGPQPEKLNPDLEFVVGELKDPTVKTLDESRGLYLSDYQQVLEKEWIKHLRSGYKINVNKKLLNKVKSL